jgi:hypothetical protein
VHDVLSRAGVHPRDVRDFDEQAERAAVDWLAPDAFRLLLGAGARNAIFGPTAPPFLQPLASAGLMGIVAAIGAIKLSMLPPHAGGHDDARAVELAVVTAAEAAGGHAATVLRSMGAYG